MLIILVSVELFLLRTDPFFFIGRHQNGINAMCGEISASARNYRLRERKQMAAGLKFAVGAFKITNLRTCRSPSSWYFYAGRINCARKK